VQPIIYDVIDHGCDLTAFPTFFNKSSAASAHSRNDRLRKMSAPPAGNAIACPSEDNSKLFAAGARSADGRFAVIQQSENKCGSLCR